MDEVTRTHPHCGMMLLGDFNQLPDLQLKSYPLQQMVKSATRGEAILDKIYTNIPGFKHQDLFLLFLGLIIIQFVCNRQLIHLGHPDLLKLYTTVWSHIIVSHYYSTSCHTLTGPHCTK